MALRDEKEQILQRLHKAPLFADVAPAILEQLLRAQGTRCMSYQKGDTIFERTHFERALGLILQGHAQVFKRSADGHRIRMSVLRPGDLLGAATLFHDYTYYAAEIQVLAPCRILFIPQPDFFAALQQDAVLLEHYLTYLTQRIYFLNTKIDTFTSLTIESRLLYYLREHSHVAETGERQVELDLPFNHLAETLNIGRASLYRVLEELGEAGLIRKEGSRITLLD